MPTYMIFNVDGDWDGGEILDAESEADAAIQYRTKHRLGEDHPIRICTEEDPNVETRVPRA